MGDPAGIGPEIVAKAWTARAVHALAPFFAVGDPRAIEKVWDGPIARIGRARKIGYSGARFSGSGKCN